MASTDTNTYAPDYAVHPGEILDETLFARGIKKADFAADMGIAPGVVVGRIQFDKIIPYSWLNGLTRKFVICESKT